MATYLINFLERLKMEVLASADMIKNFLWVPIAAWFGQHLRKRDSQIEVMQLDLVRLKENVLSSDDAREIISDAISPILKAVQSLDEKSNALHTKLEVQEIKFNTVGVIQEQLIQMKRRDAE